MEAKRPHWRHELQLNQRFIQYSKRNMTTIGLSGRLLGAVAVSLVVMVWLGFQIIADTAGQNAAILNPSLALAWNSDEVSALDELARLCLV